MAYYYSPFRNSYNGKRSDPGCVFCDDSKMSEQVVRYPDGSAVENEHYRWVINQYPKFEGHTMVVPKKHLLDLAQESRRSLWSREKMIRLAASTLQDLYPGSGVEIFLQTGVGSEGSVDHLHWHVVPAQPSDPLRSFDKLGQFYTVEADQPRLLIFPIEIKWAQKSLLKQLTKTLGVRKEGSK